MREIFFVSDTHFGHANMLKFKHNDGNLVRPGFKNADHMNEHMIERWNSVVRDHDIVYHLGDVGLVGDQKKLKRILWCLKGRKRLILGNHDRLDVRFYREHFQEVMLCRDFRDSPYSLFCTHIPIHEGSLKGPRGQSINVHGHLHRNVISNPFYFNVSVEMIDYTPISYDEIKARVQRKLDDH